MGERPPPRHSRGSDFVLRDVPMLDSPVSCSKSSSRPADAVRSMTSLRDEDRDYSSLTAPAPLVLPPGRASVSRGAKKEATTTTTTRTRTPVIVSTTPHTRRLARRISDRQAEIMRGLHTPATQVPQHRTSSPKNKQQQQQHVSPPVTTSASSSSNPVAAVSTTTTTLSSTVASRQPIFSSTQQASTLQKRVKPVTLPASVKVKRVKPKAQSSSTSFSISYSENDENVRHAVYSAMECREWPTPPRPTTVPQRSRLVQETSSWHESVSEAPHTEQSLPPTMTGSSTTSSGSGLARQRRPSARHVDSTGDASANMPHERRARSFTSSLSSQLSGFVMATGSGTSLAAAAISSGTSTDGEPLASQSARPPVRPLQAKYFTLLERKERRGGTDSSSLTRTAPPAHHRPSLVHVSSRTDEGVFTPLPMRPQGAALLPHSSPGVAAGSTGNSPRQPLSASYGSASLLMEGWPAGEDSPYIVQSRARAGAIEEGGSYSLSNFPADGASQSVVGSRLSSDEAFTDITLFFDFNIDSTTTSTFVPPRTPAPPQHLSPSPSVSGCLTGSTSHPHLYRLPSPSQRSADRPHDGASTEPPEANPPLPPSSHAVPHTTLPVAQRASVTPVKAHTLPSGSWRAAPIERHGDSTPNTTVHDTRPGAQRGVLASKVHPPPQPPSNKFHKATTATEQAGDGRVSSIASNSADPTFARLSLYQWNLPSPGSSERDLWHTPDAQTPRNAGAIHPTAVAGPPAPPRRETWPLDGSANTATARAQARDGGLGHGGEQVRCQRPVARSVGDGGRGAGVGEFAVATRRFVPVKDRHLSIPSSSGGGMTSSNLGESSSGQLSTQQQQQQQHRLSTSSRGGTGSAVRSSGEMTVLPWQHSPKTLLPRRKQ